jgi:hypothetical protein
MYLSASNRPVPAVLYSWRQKATWPQYPVWNITKWRLYNTSKIHLLSAIHDQSQVSEAQVAVSVMCTCIIIFFFLIIQYLYSSYDNVGKVVEFLETCILFMCAWNLPIRNQGFQEPKKTEVCFRLQPGYKSWPHLCPNMATCMIVLAEVFN